MSASKKLWEDDDALIGLDAALGSGEYCSAKTKARLPKQPGLLYSKLG